MKKYCVKIFFKLTAIFKHFQDSQITLKITYECNKIGSNPTIEYPISTLGLSCFTIGDNFNIRKDCKLRAYQDFAAHKYYPEIFIGNNFYMGTHSNILIIGKLTIGNNVTLASRVTIIDHSHGKLDETDIDVPVMERALISKGPIYIADNVWIGEGAVILGSITIGKNSIVGANAVVTKDVPPYSIVGGIPAKIIRIIPH